MQLLIVYPCLSTAHYQLSIGECLSFLTYPKEESLRLSCYKANCHKGDHVDLIRAKGVDQALTGMWLTTSDWAGSGRQDFLVGKLGVGEQRDRAFCQETGEDTEVTVGLESIASHMIGGC